MADRSLLDELERALPAGSESDRAEMLSRMTDLFVAGSDGYSPEQINLFDELLTKLIMAVESSARAELARRLAPLPNGPAGALRTLAFDDNIEVARPALSAETLRDADLVTNASTKSQEHLLAISKRKSLSETVTDVLVTRGDRDVVQGVAENAGANFSYLGFNLLVRRSAEDESLTKLLTSRADVPRQHMLALLDRASEAVRERLKAQNPAAASAVLKAVEQAESSIRGEIRTTKVDYTAARAAIETLRRAGKLDEARLVEFAREGKTEETVVTLSTLSDVDIGTVEHAMSTSTHDVLLILVKLAGFSWDTAKQVLRMHTFGRGMSPHDFDMAMSTFARLNVGTARQMLDYHNHQRVKAAQSQKRKFFNT